MTIHLPAGENLSRCGVPVGDVCVACAAAQSDDFPLPILALDLSKDTVNVALYADAAQATPPLVANKVFAGCICTVGINPSCPALSHQWAEL